VFTLALIAAAGLVPVGCGTEENVTKTQVPKSTERGRRVNDDPESGEYRILGAMFPAENPRWFFKLVGPADALSPHVAGFDQLIGSVALPAGDGRPEFTTPEGWTLGKGRDGIVAATVKTPDGKYELTVASASGSVQSNLKRWAVDQLGVVAFGPDEVAKCTKTVEAKGVKGLRADLRGPKKPPTPGKGGPMMGGMMPGDR
jgi:hypothetical protein